MLGRNGTDLEAILRAGRFARLNLFRNTVRGGWEAAIALEPTSTTFSVGIDDDPVAAIEKAYAAFVGKTAAPAKIAPTPAAPVAVREPNLTGGIFG